jgi:hypothetical protein
VVENSLFLGNCYHVQARLSTGEPAVAEVEPVDRMFETGERVHVWWHASDELNFPEAR